MVCGPDGHNCLIFKLQSVGAGRKVLGILTEFLSATQQLFMLTVVLTHILVCLLGLLRALACLLGLLSVFGPLLFILYSSDMWFGITKKMLANTGDTSLYADTGYPATRQVIADSLTVDIIQIQSWCSRWAKIKSQKVHRNYYESIRFRPLLPNIQAC